MKPPTPTMALVALALALAAVSASAVEYHVATTGDDANAGTAAAPLRSIQRGAELAQPGDVVTVHRGIYRERVNPPRGGVSDARRIVFQATEGEQVEVRGSEVVGDWVRVRDDTWKATLPNTFFGTFNPFADVIRGDWFDPRGRRHHTGAVYLDGEWLAEAASHDDVMKPAGPTPLWFARVEAKDTTIWAQFKGTEPNRRLVEVNARRAVFYPDKPGRNYITVRGFTLRHAATPWAPPTAEQVALIGTHWSRGWVIEDNTISHSTCSGVSLGKYGDRWDNTSADTAEGYVKTIERALKDGWHKESIGHHVVRNNRISHCEQAGIVGSLGCAFSEIRGNTIHDVHVRRLFSGAEMAGIKFHGAIDTQITSNHVYRTVRGVWLDWMAQGTRVSGNLLHDNAAEDLFVEVNHGPFLVDNNLFLSTTSLLDWSEGGAYAHNLFAGRLIPRPEPNRATPFHKPHSTELSGLRNIAGGDDRFHNNVLIGPAAALAAYDAARLPCRMDGNVFLNGAKPSAHERDPVTPASIQPPLKLIHDKVGVYLEISLPEGWAGKRARERVTSELLGNTAVPNAPYERPDGTPISLDADYFGKPRHASNPVPGPFEDPGVGSVRIKLR